MDYVQVSKRTLCDLLSCKSKVTEMTFLCDRYAEQLHRMGFLVEFRDILDGNACRASDDKILSDSGE